MRENIINSVLAGMCISIGGYAFLLSENKVIGSLLFSIGLFLICTNGYNLFTGKVCYITSIRSVLYVFIVLVFNLIACFAAGRLTRIMNPALIQVANTVAAKKMGELPLQIFLLAIMCNVLIYFAVNSFRMGLDPIAKYLAIILCVVVFINCGFEHCIANMYYLSVADFNIKAVEFLNINIIGNAVGGILIRVIDNLT